MDAFSGSGVTALAGVGVVAGLFLLARGLGGYRSLVRVTDTSTSTISSLAAGEVRVTGVIEAAELTLVSLLRSVPSVYYRSTIRDGGETRTADSGYTEERSIGFRIRDATGSLRVFPRGARFDAPVRFADETPLTGDEPAGLDFRFEGSTHPAETDHATAAMALLTIRVPEGGTHLPGLRDGRRRRSYREMRLEPGDPVTIVGRALPLSDLADPGGADVGAGSDVLLDDPEVAADIAAARDRRELYNDQVYRYNTRIAQVPGALLAPLFGWRPREFFAVDPAETVRPETDLGTT